MGLLSCFRKVQHLGFVLSGDSLLRLRGDLSYSPADDIILPKGEISAIAALSPRKIVIVCGSDIFLCSKKKIVKIYEGGTIKPLIGCCGKTLFAALNGRRQIHQYNVKDRKFEPLCIKFQDEDEKLFSIGNSNVDSKTLCLVVYKQNEAISRVLEVDLNTFDRRDLNCPGDVMAVYQCGDRIFATGSVSAQNTKQFYELNCRTKTWVKRADRTHGVTNQTTDKVLFVDGFFISFVEKAASSGKEVIEVYDVKKEVWNSQDSEFSRIRAVACC
ncbi:uncharacterized protein LOC100906394 [Galendromus occidentalis]|uniref:Uncharacterized protein LOC100906394 n=1 Tax=Galendromus occidentalis TaxID=34638 RepID=A0AAJ6VVW1_9ACAR|nr:uncharacterized protein LOC100906394 [Galendromus occidentalis]